MAANAVGFRIAAVRHCRPKASSHAKKSWLIAGICGRTSLPCRDAAETRARLKSNPWVGDATVQKLFPDRLAITVTERAAFAYSHAASSVVLDSADGEAIVAGACITIAVNVVDIPVVWIHSRVVDTAKKSVDGAELGSWLRDYRHWPR